MNEETIDAQDWLTFNQMLDEQAPLEYLAWMKGMSNEHA